MVLSVLGFRGTAGRLGRRTVRCIPGPGQRREERCLTDQYRAARSEGVRLRVRFQSGGFVVGCFFVAQWEAVFRAYIIIIIR